MFSCSAALASLVSKETYTGLQPPHVMEAGEKFTNDQAGRMQQKAHYIQVLVIKNPVVLAAFLMFTQYNKGSVSSLPYNQVT